MSEPRKLLTFLADFLLDEGEAYPLRGEALRQAVLRDPRAELTRYGLRAEHVDLLLEHGPSLAPVMAAVRAEAAVALAQGIPGGTESEAPFLWPGDELFVECVAPEEGAASGEIVLQADAGISAESPLNATLAIVGGGFDEDTRFFFEKAGARGEQGVYAAGPSRSQIEACPNARQLVSHQFSFPSTGTWYLRARERPGEPAHGLNDKIRVRVEAN